MPRGALLPWLTAPFDNNVLFLRDYISCFFFTACQLLRGSPCGSADGASSEADDSGSRYTDLAGGGTNQRVTIWRRCSADSVDLNRFVCGNRVTNALLGTTEARCADTD